jgi:hypothetical protein
VRLWSIHPKYLDRAGLVALWREALLAQAVLRGRTRGYRHHPQLERFRSHPHPRRAIAAYLATVLSEAEWRGYRFDRAKVGRTAAVVRIPVAAGQLDYEMALLRFKLRRRAPQHLGKLAGVRTARPNPVFRRVPGSVATWERPRPGIRSPRR